MFWPSRVTRYIFSELIPPFTLGLLFFSFLLLMNQLFLVAEKALAKNLGLGLTLQLLGSFIPNMLVMSIPMATLLGVMIGMGRLSADHEWTAIQASGLGPTRVLRAVLLFAIIPTAASLLVYWVLVPRATAQSRQLNTQVLLASNLASDLQPGIFYDRLQDIVLFVDSIRPTEKKRLEGVFLIIRQPNSDRVEFFTARYGDIYPDTERPGWLIADLYDGALHRYQPESGKEYELSRRFDFYQFEHNAARLFEGLLTPNKDVKSPSDMNWNELWAHHRLKQQERDRLAEIVAKTGNDSGSQLFVANHAMRIADSEVQSRFALPLACALFALLALPLGVTRVRSGKGAGFALSLLIILIYWVIYTTSGNQVRSGKIPGWLGPWLANLALLPWAAIALWRMRRPTGQRVGLIARTLLFIRRSSRKLRQAFRAYKRPADSEALPPDEVPLEDFSGTPNRFVGRFDMYVVRTYLRILGLTLGATYLVYGLVEFKAMADRISRTGQSYGLILEFFQYFAPGALSIVLPVSCMVGAVVTFTVLTRTGELTAIKASGISMQRATVPVLILTTLLCGILYLNGEHIAPESNRKARAIKDQAAGRPPRTYVRASTGAWSFGPDGNQLFNYKAYDANENVYRDLTVFSIDRSNTRILDQRYSPAASWNGSLWELQGGWFRSFPKGDSPSPYRESDEVVTIEMEPPEQINQAQLGIPQLDELGEQLAISEIRDEIANRERRGMDTSRLVMQYYGKFSGAWAPLVMVILGLPFAFKVGRRGSMYGVGVSLLLVLVYWATFAAFNAMGLQTLLDPRLAAWGPNILFGLLGAYLMLYIKT